MDPYLLGRFGGMFRYDASAPIRGTTFIRQSYTVGKELPVDVSVVHSGEMVVQAPSPSTCFYCGTRRPCETKCPNCGASKEK